MDAVEQLDLAIEQLKASSRVASDRLRAIWNPDTRKYEPYAEMVAMHDIINKNLSTWHHIDRARRVLVSVKDGE
mgnify:CR=1 FL=1